MIAIARSPLRAGRSGLQVAYTPEDFARIARFLHQSTGIRLTDANEHMVYARIYARVQELGFDSFAAYLDQAFGPDSADERERCISALTTNTTYFYRESYHFDYLETHILPDLIPRALSGERIRIWSAGCSTGEEAYSIAISLLNAFPEAVDHDVKILATDVDQAALACAMAATYAPKALRDLPPPLLETGLEKIDDSERWRPKPHVRSLITFRPLNLIGEWPFQGRFDVIFCRNVAIYMDEETQEAIWSRFCDALHPGGHLFVGHSERLSPSLRSSFASVGNTIYRRTALKRPT